MVKRTTISVPDKLYKKMDKWRNSINFSKEFQNHISKLIEKKEELEEIGDIEMREIIERLREEKMAVPEEPVVDYTEKGYEDGFEWAKESSYYEIQEALAWDPAKHTYPNSDHDGFSDYFPMAFAQDEHMNWEDWMRKGLNEYNSKWVDGWKDGVEAFWNKVKDLI